MTCGKHSGTTLKRHYLEGTDTKILQRQRLGQFKKQRLGTTLNKLDFLKDLKTKTRTNKQTNKDLNDTEKN